LKQSELTLCWSGVANKRIIKSLLPLPLALPRSGPPPGCFLGVSGTAFYHQHSSSAISIKLNLKKFINNNGGSQV
jgi:hypothetical protein